jgi:hypothetical protein
VGKRRRTHRSPAGWFVGKTLTSGGTPTFKAGSHALRVIAAAIDDGGDAGPPEWLAPRAPRAQT